MGNKWRVVKETVGKGVKEGAKRGISERVSSGFAGGSSGGSSNGGGSSGSSGSGINFGQVIPILIVFLLLGGGVYLFTIGDESGFWETKFGVKLEPVVDTTKNVVRGVGRNLQQTVRMIEGKDAGIFSLEEEFTEREKTGLELGDVKVVSGIGYNNLYDGSDLEVRSSIKVNKLPENVEKLDVNVECYFDDDTMGLVSTGRGSDEKTKKITIINPEKGGVENINIDCLISKDDVEKFLSKDKDRVYYKSNLRFEVSYSRKRENAERVSLDIFIIQDENLCEEYKGIPDEAFKKLASGEFKDYYNPVSSKMRYRGDAIAKMSFYEQPLCVDEIYKLFFQFKNNIVGRGNVSITGFKINLPVGFELRDCEYLENNGNLKTEYFDSVNKQLGGEWGESKPYYCKVYVGHGASAGAVGDLIKLDPYEGLTARFEYELNILKEKVIQINTQRDVTKDLEEMGRVTGMR